MTPGTIAILSLSMSADAFAAAVGRGAAHRPSVAGALRAGLVFGVIEGITPLIGWALGIAAAGYVEQIDHWIAFGLLAIVGGKMIWDARKKDDEEDDAATPGRLVGPLALVATAIGTSIDAAAIGVGLAFIGANIWIIALSIGCTTFICTSIGMLIGKAVGRRFGTLAELIGGVALIAIGVAILVDHLGLLAR